MSLAIRDVETVPPESWHYHIKETNVTITTKNYHHLFRLISEHCKSNKLTEPTRQEVIDFICKEAHVPCYDAETKVPLINKMGLPFVRLGTGCCAPIPRKEAA